ncbi:FAD-dependent oxidoreductase [Clostridium sp. SHJSY1]|uniref:FAD-dependent oxidoreductase n=1 Tax=Clostridium sp. SHJSY1 TaxID=2942483 RepID=UPI0028763397|nr:FAD-dependent oxidoreductase [Clostridium sp. SHJSY1]MDS0525228.1 FAD-dependent oxidoreductase [Clostridium sp. SHJSY1]
MNSVWNESCKFEKRNSLDKDIETDVLIIGAGIVGLLTGYLLKEQGINAMIIDAKKICSGNTKNTTAKITSQHDLIYDKIIKEYGEDRAKQYAEANEAAIKKYKEIIEKNYIDCNFEEKDAYIYSFEKDDRLQKELDAALKAGIKAKIVYETDLPFEVNEALMFENQAQFNPLKFLKAISNDLDIYENTMAQEIKDDVVTTDKGKIKANHIVVATHYPFINAPGYYFLRMHQERSYVIALENASNVNGMYIDLNEKGFSFRNYENLLLIGGGSVRTGENKNGGAYAKIRKKAWELFPDAKEVYHWAAQDCITPDGIPYIGQYASNTPNLYVATGFNKWGMTSSMVSAQIISDMILGKENELSHIFSPHRFDFSAYINQLVKDGAETVKNFTMQKIYIPLENRRHIKVGEADIVEYEGRKVGVYRDSEEKYHMVSTKCSHLGCQLQWNADDLTWECPCHGSRYDYNGNWIEGPSIHNIENDK